MGRFLAQDALFGSDLTLDEEALKNGAVSAFGTPLHLARQSGRADAAIFLIEHGANMWQEDPDGLTPIKLACIHNNQSLVRYLVAQMKPWELSEALYFLCAGYNQCTSVKTLIEAGANVIDKQHHTTALHYATKCRKNNLRTIQVLLESGLSVGITSLGGNTPLHTACEANSPYAIQNLIRCGVDINAQNKAGETPIFLLVRNSRAKLETLAFMKEHGADLSVITHEGKTLTDALCYNPNRKRLQTLRNGCVQQQIKLYGEGSVIYMNYIAVPNLLFHYEIEGKQIIRDYPLSPAALRVYVYLLGCSFRDDAVMVKYRTIVSRCHFSDHKTAVAAISELEDQGLVSRFHRAGEEGRKIANGYTVRKLPGHYFRLDKAVMHARMDSYAFSVYLCLCMHANRHHRAFPSVARISCETGLTKVGVRRKISYLSERLFIRKISSKSDCGDMNNNEYRITPLDERNAAYAKLRKIHKRACRLLLTVRHEKLVTESAIGYQLFFALRGRLHFTHRFLYAPGYDNTKRKRQENIVNHFGDYWKLEIENS